MVRRAARRPGAPPRRRVRRFAGVPGRGSRDQRPHAQPGDERAAGEDRQPGRAGQDDHARAQDPRARGGRRQPRGDAGRDGGRPRLPAHCRPRQHPGGQRGPEGPRLPARIRRGRGPGRGRQAPRRRVPGHRRPAAPGGQRRLMPVLFSALVPPDDVVEAVTETLGDPGDGLRWEPPERWHITLAYYGADDPDTRAAWLADRLAGRPAVDVRLEKAATFPGVLWLTAAGSELTPLAHAAGAGAEARSYTAHLTLARFPREEPGLAARWTE